VALKDSAKRGGELQAPNGNLSAQEKTMTLFQDRQPSLSGSKTCSFRADDVKASEEFRKAYESKLNVVLAEDMPWEQSADGLVKHLVHHKLNTRECCVEAYMQFLKPGEKSGKHRHMWEEIIFVAEGSGYDLHWDLKFDCLDAFQWEWAPEPRAYSWKRGDYIYVPPFTIHQHVAGDHEDVRLIVISNRIVKEMGFDWFDQVESAPGFESVESNGDAKR
jgi:quercetin dioxygenase-like cupin family protein